MRTHTHSHSHSYKHTKEEATNSQSEIQISAKAKATTQLLVVSSQTTAGARNWDWKCSSEDREDASSSVAEIIIKALGDWVHFAERAEQSDTDRHTGAVLKKEAALFFFFLSNRLRSCARWQSVAINLHFALHFVRLQINAPDS